MARSQRVKVQGFISDWDTPLGGIPQGTILGPLLFEIFVNDAPLDGPAKLPQIEGTNPQNELEKGCEFVDDIVMWGEGSGPEQRIDLQKRVDELWDWANNWGIGPRMSNSKWG